MQYGTVVHFSAAKGFGFIQADSGPDVFFHVTALGACQSHPQIELGQPVKYELERSGEARSAGRTTQQRATGAKKPEHPQAMLVELIDSIPGATLDKADNQQPVRHPRARKKKPGWRR